MADSDAPLAIVDIDGVVADVRHRLHHIEGRRKSWQGFFDAAGDDGLHEEGRAIVERLREDHEVIYLTGRPRWLQSVTDAWLEEHGLGGHRLVMRPDDDRRPAAQLKVDVLRRLAAGRTVGIVVDDDARVIRRNGRRRLPHVPRRLGAAAPSTSSARLAEAQEEEGRT